MSIEKNFDEKGLIAIKPLVMETATSMGMEKHGLVLFPGTDHSEPMIFKVVGGKKFYVTGLDEEHSSVQSLSDPDAKKAKIKMIRETVAYLEKKLHFHDLDVKDKDFWSKVKTFRPDNAEYFGKIRLEFTNDDIYLFPDKEIRDLVLYHSILAGGFSMCSKDLESCKRDSNKWYLSIERDVEKIETSFTRLKNQAVVSLEELFNAQNDNLFYVTKVLIPDATRFKKSSSRDSMYAYLNDFLNGNKHEKNISKAVEAFRKVLKYSKEELIVRAMIADCTTYKIFLFQNNVIVNKETGKILGSNTEEVIQYFSNPLNREEHVALYELLKTRYWM